MCAVLSWPPHSGSSPPDPIAFVSKKGTASLSTETIHTFDAEMLLFPALPANLLSAPGNPFVFPLPRVLYLPWALSNFTVSWKMNLFSKVSI